MPGLPQIGVDVAQSGFDLEKLNTYDVGNVRRRLMTGCEKFRCG
ncbi:MAG: hypothetical protein RIC18_07365 [Hoeflea sp.]